MPESKAVLKKLKLKNNNGNRSKRYRSPLKELLKAKLKQFKQQNIVPLNHNPKYKNIYESILI